MGEWQAKWRQSRLPHSGHGSCALRTVAPGESVSYSATWRADHSTTVATIAAGYADGFLRAADSAAGPAPPRAIELGGYLVPVVGRVTMDMCMVELRRGSGLAMSLPYMAASSRWISRPPPPARSPTSCSHRARPPGIPAIYRDIVIFRGSMSRPRQSAAATPLLQLSTLSEVWIG